MGGALIEPSLQHCVKVFRLNKKAILPEKKTKIAAGFDLCTLHSFALKAGQRYVVHTGLVVQPPPGFHTYIFDRSGLAYKYNIMLSNSVGVIDRDYAGPADELKVMLYMPPITTVATSMSQDAPHSEASLPVEVSFEAGDRIAQLVFAQTCPFDVVEVDKAPSEDRGGFGSTGLK